MDSGLLLSLGSHFGAQALSMDADLLKSLGFHFGALALSMDLSSFLSLGSLFRLGLSIWISGSFNRHGDTSFWSTKTQLTKNRSTVWSNIGIEESLIDLEKSLLSTSTLCLPTQICVHFMIKSVNLYPRKRPR